MVGYYPVTNQNGSFSLYIRCLCNHTQHDLHRRYRVRHVHMRLDGGKGLQVDSCLKKFLVRQQLTIKLEDRASCG